MFTFYLATLSFLLMLAEALPASNGTEFADHRFTKGDGTVHKIFSTIGILAGCFVFLGLAYFVVCKVKWSEQVLPCIKARQKKSSPPEPQVVAPSSQQDLPTYEMRDYANMPNPYVYQPKPPAPVHYREIPVEIRRKPVPFRDEAHWRRASEESMMKQKSRAKRSSPSRQVAPRKNGDQIGYGQSRIQDQQSRQTHGAPSRSRY